MQRQNIDYPYEGIWKRKAFDFCGIDAHVLSSDVCKYVTLHKRKIIVDVIVLKILE